MLMAMTRRPLSASISRTVSTVSYSIEFPTFFDESVLVATYKNKDTKSRCLFEVDIHLSKNIVHSFARLYIAFSEETQQAQNFHLQKWIRNT